MKRIELADAHKSLAEYALESLDEPMTVVHQGRPVAVLCSATEADEETIALSTNKQFLAILEKSRQSYRDQGGIPAAEVRRRLEELERLEAANSSPE